MTITSNSKIIESNSGLWSPYKDISTEELRKQTTNVSNGQLYYHSTSQLPLSPFKDKVFTHACPPGEFFTRAKIKYNDHGRSPDCGNQERDRVHEIVFGCGTSVDPLAHNGTPFSQANPENQIWYTGTTEENNFKDGIQKVEIQAGGSDDPNHTCWADGVTRKGFWQDNIWVAQIKDKHGKMIESKFTDWKSKPGDKQVFECSDNEVLYRVDYKLSPLKLGWTPRGAKFYCKNVCSDLEGKGDNTRFDLCPKEYCLEGSNIHKKECQDWCMGQTGENRARCDTKMTQYCQANPQNQEICACLVNHGEYQEDAEKIIGKAGYKLDKRCWKDSCINTNAYKTASAPGCPTALAFCLADFKAEEQAVFANNKVEQNCDANVELAGDTNEEQQIVEQIPEEQEETGDNSLYFYLGGSVISVLLCCCLIILLLLFKSR